MGVGSALKGFYRACEDKYYAFVDWLDGKGLSLYPVIDKIEEKNVPSFVVLLAVLVLIVAGIFLAFSLLVLPGANVTLTVLDLETGVPIGGAKVTLTTAAGAEVVGTTDADGMVSLSVASGKIEASVEKTGYEKGHLSFDAAGEVQKEIELEAGIALLARTINVFKAGTTQLLAEDVTIRFRCSEDAADFDELKTVSSGSIDLQVPSNCGSLVASPVSGYTATNGTLDIEDTSPQLFLEVRETNAGTINVFVESVAGEALSGITVMIYGSGGILAGTQYSNAAGTASFAGVATGRYYVIVHDSQGRYADFDSSMLGTIGVKELAKDAVISFDVELQNASVGKVKVLVKDSVSRQPVDNAKVLLKKGGTVMDTGYTGAQGTVEFSVGENVEYSLEIDADAYIIGIVPKALASESYYEVLIEPATADNTQVLDVGVVDSRSRPVEGARLVLKKSDGTIFANNVVTGADGKGSFSNLPLATYYVYAVKKGFEGKNSDPIAIKARQENKVTVVLPIGFGNIEVEVLNDELQPVQGAVVEAMGFVSNEKEQEEITSLEGKSVFNFRADKVVFFKVDADGFLPYYSIAVSPDADSTVAVQIALAKDPGKLEVKLLGLYQNGELAPNELTPGQKYTARLVLLVPKNSSFDEAGLHLRAGNADEGKTNIMEEDSLYLKNVFASSASVLRGTSYTPPKGYAIDSTHLTTGDSKWVNVSWKNVSQGAYAVEAEVQVSEASQLGQLLYLSYRGWGKKGTFVRAPADNALAGGDSTAKKQALYANTNNRAYTAGPSSLCGINFCKTFSIEDTARNLKVSVVKEYGAAIGANYRLNFTISSTAEQAYTNSSIEFGSKGDGLRFGKYSITDAVGIESQGTVQGYLLSKEIGDLRKESSVSGSIEFKTEKEGSNVLTMVIKSNNQPVLSEAIDIRVEAAEQLRIDIIPKEIIPGIDNKILVRATDGKGEPVSNAIVAVSINDALVTSTETNGSGEMSFTLESPGAGSKVAITAEKTGYKPAKFETTVDSSLLIITPPEINEKLDIAAPEIEEQLWLNNGTATGLMISKLKFSTDFKGLVEFEWDDDYVGRKIPANSDLNVFANMALTQKGMLVDKPIKLEGSLSIYMLSQELQQTFVQSIPVIVRIGLGGNVENEKCLEISPVKWEVIAGSDKPVAEEFTLKNNCKVDGTQIALAKLEAKLTAGKDNTLGKFVVSSDDLPGANNVTLSDGYRQIAEAIPAGFEGKISIQFVPNQSVDSGSSKMSIEFRATHSAVKGEEKIGVKLPVTAYVSNLSKCIEVIADEPLTVETMPLNTGYGLYSGAYNPYSAGGYGGYGGMYGTSGGYLGGNAYPNANYSSPYYTNYYDKGEDNSWRYGLGENSFVVKNNCSAAVEISLDIPSRLRANEETFELQPNATSKVTIESGYRMGNYSIDVLAKRKGSEDKTQKVDSVDVMVKRAGEIDEECIQLSSSKIKFNDLLGRPVNEKIFNYCYDVGVRLPSGGNVISFACTLTGKPMDTYKLEEETQMSTAHFADGTGTSTMQVINPSTGQMAGSPPWQGGVAQQGYLTTAGAQSSDMGSNCELIDSIMIYDSYTSGGEEGKTIQTVEYKIRPQLNYRKMLCEYMTNRPFQSLFGLRVMLSQTFYRVEIDSAANVRYYNPFGGASNKYFQVTLEDLWGIGDTIDECMYQAGQTGSLEKILKCKEKGTMADIGAMAKTNSLDLTAKGYQKGFVPQGEFNGDVFIYRTDPDVLNIPPGASHDTITAISPSEITQNGVKVSFKPVQTDCPLPYSGGNWGIQMTVDRSGMIENTGCAKIESQVTITVERRTFWSAPKKVTMPVKVWVLKEGIDVSSVDAAKCESAVVPPIPITKCQAGGETSPDAVKAYGFDRLKLDWSWNGIEKNTCDYKGDAKEKEDSASKTSFCDAVQFSIELNKKAEEIKKFATGLDLTVNKADVASVMGITETDATKLDAALAPYKNTENLFRWAKKQTFVEDAVNGKTLVFFAGKDNKILENRNADLGTEIKAKLDGIKALQANSNTIDPILDQTTALLNLLGNSTYKDAIVVEIEEMPVNYADLMLDLKAELDLGNTGIRIMSLAEYKQFHEKIMAAQDCKNADGAPTTSIKDAASCKIKIGTTTGEITAAFLKELITRAKFKVGTLHVKEMDAKLKAQVMEEAADIDSAKLPAGYNNFKEFYEKAIAFDSLLVKDTYNADLRADFGAYYSGQAIDVPEAKTTLDSTKFGDANASWKFNTQPEYKMQNAGLYTVLINANFSGKDNYAWDVSLKQAKSLAQLDTALGTKYAKNYFFSLPFDGEVGTGAGNSRNGYGIAIDKGKIMLEFDGKNVIGLPATGGTGMKAFSLDYGSTIAKTGSGKILSVSEGKIEFNPSTAAVVNVSMAARQGAGNEGLIYNLLGGTDTTLDSAASWFTWATGKDKFSDKRIDSLQAQALCPSIATENYHGFIMDFPGNADFKGVAFVPSEKVYKIQVRCNQGAVTSMNAIGSTSLPAWPWAGSENFELPVNSTGNNAVGTLKYYIESIGNSTVCFAGTENTVALTWNTEHFLGTSSAQPSP